jgi:hypothetical protein
VAITAREAREKILDDLGASADHLALAVACLGEAYELLTVGPADRLESELYRPVQRAYGRCKRTYAGFAERSGLPAREFQSPAPGRPSQGVKSFLERALIATAEADRGVADLQDSMLPIESGDADLRAGLTEVRELIGGAPAATREFLRTLGR